MVLYIDFCVNQKNIVDPVKSDERGNELRKSRLVYCIPYLFLGAESSSQIKRQPISTYFAIKPFWTFTLDFCGLVTQIGDTLKYPYPVEFQNQTEWLNLMQSSFWGLEFCTPIIQTAVVVKLPDVSN